MFIGMYIPVYMYCTIVLLIVITGLYVIVISRYEGDIIVITRVRGGAEDECNNKDIIRVYGI